MGQGTPGHRDPLYQSRSKGATFSPPSGVHRPSRPRPSGAAQRNVELSPRGWGHPWVYKYAQGRPKASRASRLNNNRLNAPAICVNPDAHHQEISADQWQLRRSRRIQQDVGQWKVAYKKAHAKARIKAQANEGSITSGEANSAARQEPHKVCKQTKALTKGAWKP